MQKKKGFPQSVIGRMMSPSVIMGKGRKEGEGRGKEKGKGKERGKKRIFLIL